MTLVAATLESFFTDRLVNQRNASSRTIASYRDALKLLVVYVHRQTGKTPCTLEWEDLDTEMISAFLDHLEMQRHNSARTRNLRLTAIRSLFAYASLRHPEHAALIQRVLAIPPKRFDKPTVSFLTAPEIDALIDAPDRFRWEGRRDRALLLVGVQTGLRVSELTGLTCGDVSLGTGASVRCEGKGRKHRAVPLTAPTEAVLTVWMTERTGRRDEPLFPTRTGRPLSRDAVEHLVRKHAVTAAARCPTLRPGDLHPHVLRHSCAMSLLQAGVDTSVIALWLGHADIRSTQAYLHADMTIKQRALDRTTPTSAAPGRYRPGDALLAFLEAL
jgi:site-specific recombinase XerD